MINENYSFILFTKNINIIFIFFQIKLNFFNIFIIIIFWSNTVLINYIVLIKKK